MKLATHNIENSLKVSAVIELSIICMHNTERNLHLKHITEHRPRLRQVTDQRDD